MENESQTSKNSVDQIFPSENKKQVDFFYLFQGLHVFSMEFFLIYGSIFWFYYHTHLTKVRGVAPGLIIFEVFTRLWLSTPTFCIKGYDYVKHFVRVLVLLVINTGCAKKLLKNGEHYIVDFQFKLCQNVCTGGDLCSPFLAIFLTHPV